MKAHFIWALKIYRGVLPQGDDFFVSFGSIPPLKMWFGLRCFILMTCAEMLDKMIVLFWGFQFQFHTFFKFGTYFFLFKIYLFRFEIYFSFKNFLFIIFCIVFKLIQPSFPFLPDIFRIISPVPCISPGFICLNFAVLK